MVFSRFRQIFFVFLLRSLPPPKKRRFGAFLRAKNSRFTYGWYSKVLTKLKNMQPRTSPPSLPLEGKVDFRRRRKDG